MKIRIIRRWANIPMTDKDEEVYDIYHGFGYPISKFPFLTKWKIDRAGLTREQALKHIASYVLDMSQDVKIRL